MIVLEGPDGSGKSTLGKHLADILCKELWHPGGAVPDELVREWMRKCEHKLTQGFILDRTTHISEFIYGPLINGRDLVRPGDVVNFYAKCIANNWKIIYCRPSSITLNLNQTKEDYDTDEQIRLVEQNHQELVKGYDDLFLSEKGDNLRREDCLFTYDYEQNLSFAQLLNFLNVGDDNA